MLEDAWSVENEWSDQNNCRSNYTTCIPLPAVILTIASSTATVVGSLLIICTFLRWKDLRTIARMILVFLAIADLFTGIGYIFGAGIYLHYFDIRGGCLSSPINDSAPPSDSAYYRLCEAQSFFTTLMPVTSFFWTGNLAIYLFFSIYWLRVRYAKTMMTIFHITAWGIPLFTCVVVLSTGMFGSSGSRSSGGWCWIKYNSLNSSNSSSRVRYAKFLVTEFMAGKVWEISVCILALLIWVAVKVIIWRRVKTPKNVIVESEYSSISIEKQMHMAYSKLDQKLIWLPIAFLLLRMWGNIRFFISIYCGSGDCCPALYNPALVYLQSIGDPGQGWSNALLFVIFNQRIAYRLCPCLEPLGAWCCFQARRLGPRRWQGGGEGKSVKVKKDVKSKAFQQVSTEADGGGARGSGLDIQGKGQGDRDPLLFNNSISSYHSNVSASTNMSSNSVLYHSYGKVSLGGADTERVKVTAPKNPSINSKLSH